MHQHDSNESGAPLAKAAHEAGAVVEGHQLEPAHRVTLVFDVRGDVERRALMQAFETTLCADPAVGDIVWSYT